MEQFCRVKITLGEKVLDLILEEARRGFSLRVDCKQDFSYEVVSVLLNMKVLLQEYRMKQKFYLFENLKAHYMLIRSRNSLQGPKRREKISKKDFTRTFLKLITCFVLTL